MITRLFEAKDDHMKTSNIRVLVLHWTAVIVYEICNIYQIINSTLRFGLSGRVK